MQYKVSSYTVQAVTANVGELIDYYLVYSGHM